MRKIRPIVVLLLLALLVPFAAQARVAAQDQPMIETLAGGGFGGGSNPQSNFNPYVPATRLSPFGYIYEPLVITNGINCEQVPWLATEWTWSDPQTLVFTIRDGVTWSDGTPFTAADVEFTFDMLYNHRPLDERGLWRYLTDVTAAPPQVTFSFKEPGAYLFNPLVETHIVAKHIWETVEDPVTFTNDQPVGTGPFLLQELQRPAARPWSATRTTGRPRRSGSRSSPSPSPSEGQIDQLQMAEGELRLERDVHAGHRGDLRRQGPGAQPLLVPAGRLDQPLPQPDQGAVRRRRVPQGHRPRHRPQRDRPEGAVRLRQRRQPDRAQHPRHGPVLRPEHPRQGHHPLRRGHRRADLLPTPATPRTATASCSARTASRSSSPSSSRPVERLDPGRPDHPGEPGGRRHHDGRPDRSPRRSSSPTAGPATSTPPSASSAAPATCTATSSTP